jgi:hypothetical protein
MRSSYGSFHAGAGSDTSDSEYGYSDIEETHDTSDVAVTTDRSAVSQLTGRTRTFIGVTVVALSVFAVSMVSNNVFATIGNVERAANLEQLFKPRKAIGGPIRADYVEPMMLSSSNEYGNPKSSMFSYPFLDDAVLAEPYKETTFEIENTFPGCTYTWSINDSTDDVVASGSTTDGVIVTSDLTTVGQYSLNIDESGCDNSEFARTTSQTVRLSN